MGGFKVGRRWVSSADSVREWDHWDGCRHPPARRSHRDFVLRGRTEDDTERRAGSKLAGAPRTPCADPVYLHSVAALVGY